MRLFVLLLAMFLFGCAVPDAAGASGDGDACACSGLKGAEGPEGPQGPPGAPGVAGKDGPRGPAGHQGAQGEKGAAGPQGTPGAQGPKGDTGPAGATGATGAKGSTGAQGPKGDKGDTGADGAKGAKGDTGAQGPKGDQGDPGAGPIDQAGVYYVQDDVNVALNDTSAVSIQCQSGDVLLGGSCETAGTPTGLPLYVNQNRPMTGQAPGWWCSAYNGSGGSRTLRAHAICFNAAP